MVPLREVSLEFSETEKATWPFPSPLLPEVIDTQSVLLAAVQLHPLEELTLTVPVPPEEPKALLDGEML